MGPAVHFGWFRSAPGEKLISPWSVQRRREEQTTRPTANVKKIVTQKRMNFSCSKSSSSRARKEFIFYPQRKTRTFENYPQGKKLGCVKRRKKKGGDVKGGNLESDLKNRR